MSKRGISLAVVGVLCCGIVVEWRILHTREVRRGWPSKQLLNATKLGTAVWRYHEAHGEYPTILGDLVSGGLIDDENFKELQFRASPQSDGEPWLYQAPKEMTEVILVGPKLLFQWEGDLGSFATAKADGGGSMILFAKRRFLPEWAKNRIGESGRGDGIAPVTPPTPPDMRVRIRRFLSDDGDRP